LHGSADVGAYDDCIDETISLSNPGANVVGSQVVVSGTFVTEHDRVTTLDLAAAVFAERGAKTTTVQNSLVAIGGRRFVDLVPAGDLKPGVRERVESDLIAL
jgi:hypothetical protein